MNTLDALAPSQTERNRLMVDAIRALLGLKPLYAPLPHPHRIQSHAVPEGWTQKRNLRWDRGNQGQSKAEFS